jgi:hypothetical protein
LRTASRRLFGALPRGGHYAQHHLHDRPRPARRALELVRNHLGGIGDVWIALEQNKDFATAERLGLEFGEDFQLLEDIGWGEDEGREGVELVRYSTSAASATWGSVSGVSGETAMR